MAELAVAPDVDGRMALAEALLSLANGVRPLAERALPLVDGLPLAVGLAPAGALPPLADGVRALAERASPLVDGLPLVEGVRPPAAGAPRIVDVFALSERGSPFPLEDPPLPVVRAPPVAATEGPVDGRRRLAVPLAAVRTPGADGPPRTVDAVAGPHADGPSTARSTSSRMTLRT